MRGYGYHPYGYQPYNQGLSIKGVLILTAVIIGLIVGIYIYATVKANADIAKVEPAQYTPGTYTEVESKQIRVLSESLKNDLDGIGWLGHNYDLYDQFLKLSDRLISGVCIDFQRINAGVSFRTAFQNSKTSFQAWDHFFSTRYDDVVAKLNVLNIT